MLYRASNVPFTKTMCSWTVAKNGHFGPNQVPKRPFFCHRSAACLSCQKHVARPIAVILSKAPLLRSYYKLFCQGITFSSSSSFRSIAPRKCLPSVNRSVMSHSESPLKVQLQDENEMLEFRLLHHPFTFLHQSTLYFSGCTKMNFPDCVKLGKNLLFVHIQQAGERNFFTPFSHNLGGYLSPAL